MSRRRTIRFTLGVVFAATLAVGGFSVATTLQTLHAQRNDAPVMNLLGRERMLTDNLVNHAWYLLETDDTIGTAAMELTIRQFEETLRVLRHGGLIPYADQILHIPAPMDPYPQMLDNVLASWERLLSGVYGALEDEAAGLGHEHAAGELHALAINVVAGLDEAVLSYSRQAQGRVARLRLLQFIFLVSGALTVGIGYLLLHTHIARPVAALASAMRRMGQGNLDTPVRVTVKNEIGELAGVFENMRLRVRGRIEDQAILTELSHRFLKDLEPEAIAKAMLLAVRERLDADASAFLVPGETDERVRVLAADGWADEFWDGMDLAISPPESSGVAWAVHRREPLLVDHARTDHPFAISDLARHSDIATSLIVPVMRDEEHAGDDHGSTYGVLVVHSLALRTFGPEEIEFLSLLARYAALALERTRTHQAQLMAELRYRALFNQTYQFIGLLSPDGTLLDANDTALHFSGTTREEVLGQPFWEAPWWSHSSQLQQRLKQAIATAASGEFVRFEALHPGNDGTLATVDFSLTPIRNTKGKVVMLVPEGRDITERKRAEDALRHSEQRFHGVVSIAAEAIIMMDDTQHITFFNAGAERVFGYTSAEIVGKPIWTLIPDRFRSTHGGQVRGFSRSSSNSRHMGERGAIWGLRKNGEEFPAEASISKLDLDGERIFTAVLRDVSEREALEAQLSRTRQLASIGTLTGGLAHHFNNALTSIRGHTELLLADCDDPQRRADLEQIRNSSTQAATITRQLLVFSGLQVDQPRILDLNDVIHQVEPLLYNLVREDMRLEIATSNHPLSVLADPGQIELILVNLVTNARDAMPGGGTIRIETDTILIAEDDLNGTGLTAPGNFATLRVRDTGHGMDATTMQRAFDPFFTTRSIASWSGLGLSTIYGIARQAGGGVRLTSAPGLGTTSEVLIPHAESSAQKDTMHEITGESPTSQIPSRILVVEDETGVRALVRKVLQRSGFQVLEAASGEEALNICNGDDKTINLVITDVVMPGMSGPELARHIHNRCPDIPVLFISGYSKHNIGDQGILESDVPFLEKPFAPKALMAMVNGLLGLPHN